jgi:hypothetical protein
LPLIALLATTLAGPAAASGRADAERLGAFRAYWERQALGLAQWAPETTYDAKTGAVGFTGTQGRRLRATITFPTPDEAQAGAVLHLGEAPPVGAVGDGLAHLYLPVEDAVTDPARSLLDVYQAATVLLSAPGVPVGKLAVLGSGEAAALAVAVAALRPGEVGCVAAVDPRTPAAAHGRWNLGAFAALVRCPVLVVVDSRGSSGATVSALNQALAGPHEVAPVAGVGEVVCRAWVAKVLAQAEGSPAQAQQRGEYDGGLPVDLSEQ